MKPCSRLASCRAEGEGSGVTHLRLRIRTILSLRGTSRSESQLFSRSASTGSRWVCAAARASCVVITSGSSDQAPSGVSRMTVAVLEVGSPEGERLNPARRQGSWDVTAATPALDSQWPNCSANDARHRQTCPPSRPSPACAGSFAFRARADSNRSILSSIGGAAKRITST
jgi:hypothetical protein